MDDKLTLSYYTSATSFAIFLYYNNPIIPKSTLKHIHVAAVICLFAQVLYRIFFYITFISRSDKLYRD